MKIGVMSDTHLPKVYDWLRDIVERRFQDTDMILHAGDVGSGAVMAYLESQGVITVRGNMDGNEMAHLPIKKVLSVAGFRIGLIHGWGPGHDLVHRVRKEFDRMDCLVFGHSHQAMNLVIDDTLCFNPGSVSMPRGGAAASVGLLHVDDKIYGEIIYL